MAKDYKLVNEDFTKDNQEKEVCENTTTTKPKLSILTVKDGKDNQEFTLAILNMHYITDAATDGYKAIEKAKNKVYDIIFMDINLGKCIDGIRSTKEIRKVKGYKNIPIEALTAYTREGDKEEFFANGCTHYLGKPFSIKQLEKLVEDIAKDIYSKKSY